MTKRRTAQEWSEIVERWQRSGQSAKEFAEAEGVVASTLSWWRTHLRGKGRASKKAAAGRAEAKRQVGQKKRRQSRRRMQRTSAEPPIQLVELVATEVSRLQETPVELVVGTSALVRVRRGFDPETLRQVLAICSSEGKAAC